MLLNALRVKRCKSCEELRFELWREFPSLGCEIDAAAVLCCLGKVADGPLVDEWRRAVAEELLLAKSTEALVSDDLLKEFGETSPFGNEVTLRDVWELPAACAVFPLASAKRPGIGHVWVIKGLKHRDQADGAAIIPDDYGVCFVTTHGGWGTWSGKSWQLAGKMAQEATSGDRTIIQDLASKWIITGQVDQEKVDDIKLGNKLDLGQRNKRWNWLIPRNDMKKVGAEAQTNLTIRSATNLTTAWNIVSGTGTKDGDTEEWPEAVDELHMLVGASLTAQIASAIYTQGKKIVLWHSNEERISKGPAKLLEDVLTRLNDHGFEFPDIELKLIDSANIVQAEKTVLNYPWKASKTYLFNITSGNRLMGLAAQTLARLHPQIGLIYRDIDANPHIFSIFRFDQYPPSVGTLDGSRFCREAQIKWDFIYAKPPVRPLDTVDAYLEKILSTRSIT